jgi:hypothetical protein
MTQNRTRRKKAESAEAIPDPEPGTDFDLIAIDPGDVYCGVAFFKQFSDGWACVDAVEFDPDEFDDSLAETVLTPDSPPGTPPLIIVFEKWRLYADHAMEKTGDEFLATQHIGVIKFIARTAQAHVAKHKAAEEAGTFVSCEVNHGMCINPSKQMRDVILVKQPADIKKPTAGILRKKDIKSVAKPIAKAEYGGRDHIVDAELHGWRHIIKDRGEGPRPS